MSSLFAFRGRMSRSRYLWFQIGQNAVGYLGLFLLIFGLIALDVKLPPHDIPSYVPRLAMPQPLAIVVTGVAATLMVLVAWSTLSIDVRRLHDIGVSGWFVLLSFVLTKVVPDPAHWPDMMLGLGTLVWNVALVLIPGTNGPNKYDDAHMQKLDGVF